MNAEDVMAELAKIEAKVGALGEMKLAPMVRREVEAALVDQLEALERQMRRLEGAAGSAPAAG